MKNYFKPNSKRAIKLATALKGLTATMATMAYVEGKPNFLFIIMIVGALANETINFLSDGANENDTTV